MFRPPARRIGGLIGSICLLVSSVAGCGPTEAEGRMGLMAAAMNDATARSTACSSDVVSNPRYASLAVHINIANTSSPTLQQMADNAKPTDEEILVAFGFYEDFSKCRPIIKEAYVKSVPTAGPLFDEAYFKADQIWLSLVQRKISWGQFTH